MGKGKKARGKALRRASEHLKKPRPACFHNLVRYYVDDKCFRVALLSSSLEIERVIETPPPIGPCPFEIIGTCNGIVCLRWGNVFLWNPATGQSRIITNTFDYYCPSRTRENCYGFGHSRETGDYKLVRMISRTDGPRVRRWAGVFTLSEGSWREVRHPDCRPHYYLESSGTHVNGTLNWVARGVGVDEASTAVLSFDLVKDEFKSICPPPGYRLAEIGRTKRKLVALKSSLLFIVYSSSMLTNRYVDIWMTRPRAAQATWTRLVRIDARDFGVPEPLGLGPRGEIYIAYNGREEVVVYELSTGSVLGKHKGFFMKPTDLYPYMESRVPLLG